MDIITFPPDKKGEIMIIKIITMTISIICFVLAFVITDNAYNLYFIIKNFNEIKGLKRFNYVVEILLVILPFFIYAMYNYINTKNPVFPYYNSIFKSEYFMNESWKDQNFGSTNILQFIFWPIYIVFNPKRAFDTRFVDIGWGLGFICVIGYIIYSVIKKKEKPVQVPEKKIPEMQRVFSVPGKSLLSFFTIAAVELVNTSCNVHEFLFAGEERMAFRADTDFLFFSCGVDLPDLPAGANHLCGTKIRMNSFFHFCKPCILGLCYRCFLFTGSCFPFGNA